MPRYSDVIDRMLKKPTMAALRQYLGIGDSGPVTEADLSFTDITTANSTSGQHGLLPKLSGNAGEFLTGVGTWTAAAGGGTVTSVAISTPAILSVAGSPVTTAGTLALSLANQNANLVFSGPTTGAAAAPTFRSLVLADIPSIDETKFSFTDITTANASSTQHGLLPKLSNVATQFLDGTGAFSTPAGGSDWDTTITKSSDQTVTNNATPQNDSELVTAITANSFYLVELLLLYSGNNTTGDYRGRFLFPDVTGGGTAMGWFNAFNAALSAAVITPVQAGSVTTWPAGDMIIGTTASSSDLLACQVRFLLRTTATAGNLQYQFGNSSAAAGRDSITNAGSTLRIKKLA